MNSFNFFAEFCDVEHLPDDKRSDKKTQLVEYNTKLKNVTKSLATLFSSTEITKNKIENVACALGRVTKRKDPIYDFGFRRKISANGKQGIHGSGGIQNFFFCGMNSNKIGMYLKFPLGEHKPPNDQKLRLVDVSEFITINGYEKYFSVHNVDGKTLQHFPFNIVKCC